MRIAAGLLPLVLVLLPVAETMAVGISIDAGLTPPEGRWILRTQVRSLSRSAPDGMGDMEMKRLMIPLVVVHGLQPQLTLGLRQIIASSTMTVAGNQNKESGFSDVYLFAKYKALRINTRNYTLGIAPLVGVEAPTGSSDISNEFWSLNAGLLFSGRAGRWGADLNAGYGFRGVASIPHASPDPGNEWSLDLALARQIPVGSSGQISIAPVLEFSWIDTAPAASEGVDLANSGESVFSFAPGLKFTRGDLIVEGLVRIPVAEDQTGMQLKVENMYLLGVRHMF